MSDSNIILNRIDDEAMNVSYIPFHLDIIEPSLENKDYNAIDRQIELITENLTNMYPAGFTILVPSSNSLTSYIANDSRTMGLHFKSIMRIISEAIKKEYPEWDGKYDMYEIVKSKASKKQELLYDSNVSYYLYIETGFSRNALRLRKKSVEL